MTSDFVDDRSFHGSWSFEDEPATRFFGVAEFRPSDGWRLRAVGDRIPVDPTAPAPGGNFRRRNVVGSCDGRVVVLLDAFSLTVPFEHPVTNADIRSSVGLVGDSVPDGWNFDRLSIASGALDEWAQFGWLSSPPVHRERVETLPLNWPVDLEAQLPHAKLTLRFMNGIRFSQTSVTATAEPAWLFEPEIAATVHQLSDSAVRPLDYLHIVCTGHNLGDWMLNVFQGDETWRELSARSRTPWSSDKWEGCARSAGQLMPFDRHLTTWFEFYTSMAGALHPLMSVFTDDQIYLETKSLVITHSLEAYHRAHPAFDEKAAGLEDIRRMKSAIRSTLDEDTNRWLSKHLLHVEDPSFRERVDQIIDYAGPLGHELTAGRPFSKRVRDVRDALTHGLPAPRQNREQWEASMQDVYFTASALMRVALLRDLGLSEHEADEAGRRLNAVRFALQRIRP